MTDTDTILITSFAFLFFLLGILGVVLCGFFKK